jgi:hypothetical protein
MRHTFATAFAIAACGLAGCSGTTMHTTWAGPQPSQMAFQHPLVMFVSRDAPIRRAAEDRMASEIPNSTQSYALVRDEDLKDMDKVKKAITDAGYDGVVVMRLQSVQQGVGTTSAIPAANYVGAPAYFVRVNDLWVDWGSSWNQVYGPDYYYDNQLVTVESAVYSVHDGQMLWSGISQTLNPSSLKSLIRSVVHKSVEEMRRNGLSS